MKRTPYLLKSAAALFLLLTAACGGPITSGTPTGGPPGLQTAGAAPTTADASQPTTAASAPSTVPAAPKPAGGPVSLQVTSPQDGAVVSTAQVQVSGSASPGAVVTVNEAIILVGADGTFNTTVSLDSGPNLIEVIASSTSGDTKTVDLTVVYQQ